MQELTSWRATYHRLKDQIYQQTKYHLLCYYTYYNIISGAELKNEKIASREHGTAACYDEPLRLKIFLNYCNYLVAANFHMFIFG